MENKQITLTGHLSELRKRIIISFAAVLLGTVLCFQFMEVIVDYLLRPSRFMDFIYLGPSELFVAYVKIALAAGFVVSSPLIFLQIWAFIRPGLKKRERIYLLLALFMGILFFAAGCVFAYFIIIPMTLNFFGNITAPNIDPLFAFDKYLEFITSLLLTFGIVFELPVLIAMLAAFGLVKAEGLKKQRKIVILIVFILAAVLTPPDVVSQILLALPMLFLYELSILIALAIEQYKEKGNGNRFRKILAKLKRKQKKKPLLAQEKEE